MHVCVNVWVYISAKSGWGERVRYNGRTWSAEATSTIEGSLNACQQLCNGKSLSLIETLKKEMGQPWICLCSRFAPRKAKICQMNKFNFRNAKKMKSGHVEHLIYHLALRSWLHIVRTWVFSQRLSRSRPGLWEVWQGCNSWNNNIESHHLRCVDRLITVITPSKKVCHTLDTRMCSGMI